MITKGNQRWRDRRDSYRGPDEPIVTRLHEVVELRDDTTPANFVRAHHYSASYPAAKWRFGLCERGDLVGVAVFSIPMTAKVLTNAFPGLAVDDCIELGRFVLLDRVAGNGETWFLARCFEQLRDRVLGVVSFSDPLPRNDNAGNLVMPGHVGTIYQAFNGRYTGRGTPRTLHVFADGAVFSDRAQSKIRDGGQGWRYAAEQLEAHGAPPCPYEDRGAWLTEWRKRLTRTIRHRGNHRYIWAVNRRARKFMLPSVGTYPKTIDSVKERSK